MEQLLNYSFSIKFLEDSAVISVCVLKYHKKIFDHVFLTMNINTGISVLYLAIRPRSHVKGHRHGGVCVLLLLLVSYEAKVSARQPGAESVFSVKSVYPSLWRNVPGLDKTQHICFHISFFSI